MIEIDPKSRAESLSRKPSRLGSQHMTWPLLV